MLTKAFWAGLALAALAACAVVVPDPAGRFAALDDAQGAISRRLHGLDIAKPEQLPTTGHAHFEGVGVVVVDPPGRQMTLLGNLVVDVDFGAGTATGRMSDVVARIEGEDEEQAFDGAVTFSNGYAGGLVSTSGHMGGQHAPIPFGGLRFDVAGRLGSASDLVELEGVLEASFDVVPDGVAGIGTGVGRHDVQGTLNGAEVRLFVGMTADRAQAASLLRVSEN